MLSTPAGNRRFKYGASVHQRLPAWNPGSPLWLAERAA